MVQLLFILCWGLTFNISVIQKSVDRKEWSWTVFGVLLMCIVPIIYYLAVLRNIEEDKPIKIEKTIYPEPTLPRAILPVSKGDEEKIGMGLARIIEEDPTLRTELNLEVHQNIVWGMGDLHLSVVKENLKEKFDIDQVMKLDCDILLPGIQKNP